MIHSIKNTQIGVRVNDKEKKFYSKYIHNISYSKYGKPVYKKSSFNLNSYEQYLQRLLNYEYRVSVERDPSEILGLSKQEELIKEIQEKLVKLDTCVIFECKAKTEKKFCSYQTENNHHYIGDN